VCVCVTVVGDFIPELILSHLIEICVWEISSHWMTACKNAWIEECKKKQNWHVNFCVTVKWHCCPQKLFACLLFDILFCGPKQYLNYVINDWEKCCRKQHINCWFLHVYPPLVTHLKQRHADTIENFTAC
jgi:hypothetical protein